MKEEQSDSDVDVTNFLENLSNSSDREKSRAEGRAKTDGNRTFMGMDAGE